MDDQYITKDNERWIMERRYCKKTALRNAKEIIGKEKFLKEKQLETEIRNLNY